MSDRKFVDYSHLTGDQAIAIKASERMRRLEAEEGSRNLLNALLRMVDGARRVS